jgi:putative transposase
MNTELISGDLDLWAYQKVIAPDLSRPRKPTDNALIEPLNDRFRTESLSTHRLMTPADVCEKYGTWCRDHNEVRPDSAIGYNTPITLIKLGDAASPSS